MRNFSKTLISMAAVMAVGSAMAAGAMAAMTASYVDTDSDNVNDSVKIEGTSAHGSSQTMLIVAGASVAQYAAADEAKTDRVIVGVDDDTYTASESTIKQIDQIDNVATGVAAFNKDVVVGTLADGNYKVLVNGVEGTVEEYAFTVNTVSEEPEVIPDSVKLGDANYDGTILLPDALMVARAATGQTGDKGYAGEVRTKYDSTDTIKIGDANLDGTLLLPDALMVARAATGQTGDKGSASETFKVYPKN